ncbi:hypothetical protein [Micromonospora foliorum]|uniref:hypothetical protein n=1 Tax=Micromonospora foliorum TaxID=2911210 RepID=UPI001EE82C5A|nr:hypothetical protein [Micromonospora foliorum]MCG5440992.1 hypothetical protein [Micromonospora foliorum]
MGDVRGRFRDDLARHPAPPLGDLVQQSVVQGRRLRRQRRLAQFGAGGSALAVLLVIGLAAGPFGVGADDAGQPAGPNVGGPGGPVAITTPSPAEVPDGAAPGRFEGGADEEPRGDPYRSAPPNPPTTVIDTVRVGPGPDGELLTTTPQGALELLTRLLPKGSTSGYASLQSSGAGPGMPYVQLYLDRGDGPGMVRLAIYQDDLGGGPRPGTVELTEVPGDCVRNKVVTVHHRGGLRIDLMICTCLIWEGKGTSPALPVLSVREATEIAANSIWGTKLPAGLVVNGAKRFSTLARSNG